MIKKNVRKCLGDLFKIVLRLSSYIENKTLKKDHRSSPLDIIDLTVIPNFLNKFFFVILFAQPKGNTH